MVVENELITMAASSRCRARLDDRLRHASPKGRLGAGASLAVYRPRLPQAVSNRQPVATTP
ncbi:hypothetical protein D3C81_2131900 [compost metagenome]